MARLVIAFFLVFLVGCATGSTTENRTAELGQVEQKEGGQIKKASAEAKCTEQPPVSYSADVKQNLDTVLKLSQLDLGSLNTEFTRNLQTLAGNTPEWTDLNSILFYICEISSNRGFSKSTSKSLESQALREWTKLRGDQNSVEELISILDMRAMSVLSLLHEEQLKIENQSKATRESSAKQKEIASLFQRTSKKFTELHGQHIYSLRSRKFSAAHKAVNSIHELLYLLRNQDSQLSEPNQSVSNKLGSGCENKDVKVALYPGPRPATVKSSSISVDWYRADEEEGRKCLNRTTKDLEDTTSTMKD
ncbi:MAG TPA: hypothetical protein VE177_08000 [Candidatus Binatus sp.]|nr:hypothetical protein [Candidatus Binatus sp.]